MDDSPRFSRTVRSMLQLKDYLKEFMRCEIGNGDTASFWFDNWCELGPLITYLGSGGPRSLRIHLDSIVSNAVRNGFWNLPPARSHQIETPDRLDVPRTTLHLSRIRSFLMDHIEWKLW